LFPNMSLSCNLISVLIDKYLSLRFMYTAISLGLNVLADIKFYALFVNFTLLIIQLPNIFFYPEQYVYKITEKKKVLTVHHHIFYSNIFFKSHDAIIPYTTLPSTISSSTSISLRCSSLTRYELSNLRTSL